MDIYTVPISTKKYLDSEENRVAENETPGLMGCEAFRKDEPKIHYRKITVTEHGHPVTELVFCYRKSDGEIGAYDTANDKFLNIKELKE